MPFEEYMKILGTGKGNFLFIEVPEEASDFSIIHAGTRVAYFHPRYKRFDLPWGDWEILFTTKSASEEDLKKIVEGFFKHDHSQSFDCWKNYLNPSGITYSKSTVAESFKSLLSRGKLDAQKNYIVLKRLDGDRNENS